jgi:hypothetical protein
MQVIPASTFERARHNLTSAARLMVDIIIDQCNVACVCADGTVIRDSIPKRGRGVGENISNK